MAFANSRRLRLALAVAALAALVALLAQLTALRGQDTDLFPRWYGLRQLLLHGRNPYGDDVSREIASQIWFFDGHVSRPESGPATPLESIYGFLYPLPGALLLAPLSLLPYPAAFTAWLLIMLVMLPAAAWLVMDAANAANAALASDVIASRSNNLLGRGSYGLQRLLAVPLALFFLPAWANLMLGQPAPAVAFLTALSIRLYACPPPIQNPKSQIQNALLSGAALTAGFCLKPHLLALLAPLWLGYHLQRWRRGERRSALFLAGVGGAMLLLGGASFVLLPSWLGDFTRAARDYVAVGPGEPAALVVSRLLLPEPLAWPAAAALALSILVWTLAAWRDAMAAPSLQPSINLPPRPGSVELRAIWRTLVATALVVPPAWETNAVMLLLPLAATLAAIPSRRVAAAVAVASATLTFALLPPYFVLGWQRGTLVIGAYLALLAGAALLPGARWPRWRRPRHRVATTGVRPGEGPSPSAWSVPH